MPFECDHVVDAVYDLDGGTVSISSAAHPEVAVAYPLIGALEGECRAELVGFLARARLRSVLLAKGADFDERETSCRVDHMLADGRRCFGCIANLCLAELPADVAAQMPAPIG